jgi:Domain of unknown function (DUF5666)
MISLGSGWLARGWQFLAMAALAVTAGISGCGGGVGVGGTGAFASGPISGFGSVIVNGVRFDDSSPSLRIETEDGTALSRSSLGLGMFAEVDSGPIGGTAAEPTALASRIRISSQLVGPVEVKGTDTLTIVDQTVLVTATTVFDDRIVARLAAVNVGDVLEVYGFFDANAGRLVATRIEPKSPVPSKWKVRGVVANLGPTSFTIGAGSFTYTGTPAGLANGAYVSVEVETLAAGPWVVSSIGAGQQSLPDLDRVEIKGSVTTFTSATSFSVNGQPVDASSATFEGTGLALGVRVEVRGAVTSGVVRATRVEIEDASSGGGGGGGSGGAFEFKDTISALDTAAKTFVVKGYTIRYAGATFEGVTADTLANGQTVQVKANPTTTANTYDATEVKLEDQLPSRARCRATCARTWSGAVPPRTLRAASEPARLSTW